MVLGADDVTPLELTSAYATIAAGGVYHRAARDPARARTSEGKIVADNAFQVQSKRVVSDGVAYETTQILKQVMTVGHGHARAPRRRPPAGRQDGHGRELRQRLVLRLHAGHRLVRVGRLPRLEQAAREHRGLRRGLRRHDPGGDLEGLHDDGATRRLPPHDLAGAQDADGLQAVQGDDLVRLQPERRRPPPAAPADKPKPKPKQTAPPRAAGARRDRPAEPLARLKG